MPLKSLSCVSYICDHFDSSYFIIIKQCYLFYASTITSYKKTTLKKEKRSHQQVNNREIFHCDNKFFFLQNNFYSCIHKRDFILFLSWLRYKNITSFIYLHLFDTFYSHYFLRRLSIMFKYIGWYYFRTWVDIFDCFMIFQKTYSSR